ncbi:MAG: serine hydrolase [Bacteroidota bacterium]
MLRFWSLVVLVTALALPTSAQDVASDVDALMEAYHDIGLFNGSVLIASGDEVVYENGFGEAEMSWGVANAPDTKHRIGSVTKQFTAALILQLVEEGEIDLDAPISRYLPDYPAEQAVVTIHQLLSHTGGIREHTIRPDFGEIMRDPTTPEAFLEVFSGEPLDFEPGTQYNYSNSGYFLLGTILERVTGETYADLLRQRLLAPLGLDDSGYQTNETILNKMASGYSRTGTGFQHAVYLDTSIPYSAGMMYSTVRDLHTWTRALHAAEPFESAETLETMLTPVLNEYGYGIGNSQIPVGDRTVQAVAHSGGIPGFASMLIYFPESEHTIAIVSNTGDGVGAIARNVAQVLHGGEAETPTPPLAAVVAGIIESDGVEAAIAHTRERRASGGSFDEFQLNTVGYELLNEGRVQEAIQIFELNVEMFPEASNPYDSLGEAYFVARDPDKAAANYLRALELNPSSNNAREMLRRIGVEPPEAEEVTVSAETLDAYVGRYALAPTFIIEITREGTQLFGQATGQPRIALAPMTQTRFVAFGVDAQVSFTREGDAPAHMLTLHQGGRNQPAERVE